MGQTTLVLDPSIIIIAEFISSLSVIAQVIESLALEDTDIKPEHIAQIKDLIQKEVTVEREAAEKEAAEKDTRAAA